jgi:hypothetical protein
MLPNLHRALTRPRATQVDINDILREFLAHLRVKVNPLPSSMLQLMGLLEKEGPGFIEKSLITIVGDVDHALVFQPDADTSVLSAVKDMFLATKQQNVNGVQVPRVVHRLAMFDAHGYIVNVVSQMDVVRCAAGAALLRPGCSYMLAPRTPAMGQPSCDLMNV